MRGGHRVEQQVYENFRQVCHSGRLENHYHFRKEAMITSLCFQNGTAFGGSEAWVSRVESVIGYWIVRLIEKRLKIFSKYEHTNILVLDDLGAEVLKDFNKIVIKES